jgi:cytochrome c-type biogenesis protein CcmH/NrfF
MTAPDPTSPPRRPHAIRLSALTVLLALVAAVALAAPAAQAVARVAPRVSLLAIERQAMCVTCKVALDESDAPQADREREYIQSLINRGEGEAEIKRSLVAQYGPTVLGLPSAHGFDLAVYLVPIVVVLGLLVLVLLLLPGWRRRARAQSAATSSAPALNAADAAKLESDLARFD